MAAESIHVQVIEIPVTNVKESVEWYREMFGLDFCFPYHEGDDEAWLNMNGLGFGLIRSNEVPRMDFVSAKGERKPFFTFQVEHIEEFHKEMKQKGANVQDLVYKKGGGYSFRFHDPNGNHLGIWGGWPEEESDQ